MKKKIKIFAGVIAIVTIMMQLMTVAQAATYDYKASHQTDGKTASVIKSAKWLDDEKTEAEITIEVRNSKKEEIKIEEKLITNADVLIALDRSATGRDIDGNSYNNNQILDTYIRDIMKNFVTGDLANNGNRVTMCEFSSSLLLYDENGWIHKSTDPKENNNYSIGLNYSLSDKEYTALTGKTNNPYKFNAKKWPNVLSGLGLTTKEAKCNYLMNSRMGAITKLYKDAGLNPFKMYGSGDVSKIDKLINNAKNHGALANNTNFDLPFMYANLLFEELYGKDGKNQNDRHPYIILISDGEPYPASGKGTNLASTANDLRWDGDWIGNEYNQILAKKLRNTYDAQIFSVTVYKRGGTDYDMLNGITGDTGASSTKNTKHIYTVKNNANAAGKTMSEIISAIHDTMKVKVTHLVPKTFEATLTDLVNTDDFKILEVGKPNIGTTSKSNGKVTWNISGINCGEKCSDGKWPTLKIKVELKDKTKIGWFNTNDISSGDDACELKIKDGETLTVGTPWLQRKGKVTIKYVDVDNPNISIKTSTVISNIDSGKNVTVTDKEIPKTISYNNEQYIFVERDDKKDIDKEIGPVNKDITVVVKYRKRYTVTEEYYKDGVKDANLTETSAFLPNATCTPEIKTISGYKHTSSTQTDAFKVTGDIVIKHYYTSAYTVTIKYINDETKGTMQKDIVITGILKGTTWPANGKTIAGEYMVTDAKGQWGKGSYEIVAGNVVVDGKKYTTSTVPNNITVNGPKEIVFHYKLKEGKFKTRLWVATYILDVSNKTRVLTSSKDEWVSETNTKYEKENKVTRPTTLTGIDKDMTNKYLGNRVIYKQSNPAMNASDIANLDKNTIAKIKLTDENFPGVIDFVYKVSEYPVIIHYVDEQGNKLLEDKIISNVPEGDTVSIDAPEKIANDKKNYGIEDPYIYKSRSDSKDKDIDDLTDPISSRTEITVVYKKPVKIIAKYIDEIEEEEIAPKFDSGYKDPDNIATWKDDLKRDIPEDYYFSSRSDGEKEQADIVASDHSVEVIYNYIKLELPSDDLFDNPEDDPEDDPEDITDDEPNPTKLEKYDNIAPVVSYPTIDKSSVLVGNSVTMKIPNTGVHGEMTDAVAERFFDISKYSGSKYPWNEIFAVTKYVQFPFDVYYNGKLYKANDKILVATISKREPIKNEFVFTIPEWVVEGNYEVKAYVSSAGTKKTEAYIDAKKTGSNYNRMKKDQCVAVGTVNIQIKGKIYDFTITNLIEDKMWPTSLFKDNRIYKARVNDDNTAIGMLPIGQGTKKQQPDKYNYGIALGSTFFYRITTLGITNKSIEIKPQFTYVDESGNEIAVDLYSLVNGKYVKLDENKTIQLQTQISNQHKQQRTDWVEEAKLRSSKESEYAKTLSKKVDLGTFINLFLNNDLKVPYRNYYAETDYPAEAEYNRLADADKKTYANSNLYNAVNHWYGEYRLPSSLIVMKRGKNPNVSRTDEYTKGYLIVSFKINSDKVNIPDLNALNNLSASDKYLSYDKQNSVNQWKEESTYNTTMTITLPKLIGQTRDVTTELTLVNTDNEYYYPVAIYQVGNRINYEVGETH